MDFDFIQQAMIFKALSDPKRIAIINHLKKGEKCACVLLEKLELTQSGLSYHMKILCDSGLVSGRPDGKWVHYSLRDEGFSKAIKILTDIGSASEDTDKCHCGK